MFKKFLIFLLAIVAGVFISCNQKAKSGPSYIFKPAPNNEAAAKIAGSIITKTDLFKGIESDIYEAEMRVYELKMNKIKSTVLEKLMKADKRYKGDNDQFLEKYIVLGKAPSKKDVDAFIKERKIPAQHVNAEMKGRVKKFLLADVKRKAVDQWVAGQLSKNPVEVYLKKPVRPVFDVKIGNAPFIGKADAKVTLVEFSDFQCPFCAKGAKILHDIKAKYGAKVKIVFKNFPLSFHNHAQLAAEAGLCANDQGGKNFWKMHDQMFADQTKLAKADLIATAKKIGLADTFSKCLESKKFAGQVKVDIEHGKKAGVKSTPTFFVNGKMVNGAQGIEVFSELIDAELKL